MRAHWSAATLIIAVACAGRTNPTPRDSSLVRVRSVSETTTVSMIETLERPARGPTALASWKPDVPPVDSGGECNLTRTSGSGATTVSALFPSMKDARTGIHLSFDSAGRLIRFSERRGGLHNFTMPPGTTAQQRDSILRVNIDSKRSTNITLDFAMDNGMAMNRGGGIPPTAVRGNVREMESLEQFGPPKARIARARRLCGI